MGNRISTNLRPQGGATLPTALLALFLAVSALGLGQAAAASRAETLFYRAERCEQDLHRSGTRHKYRHHWLRCIEKFKTVYQADPDGLWAAAGLFKAGDLYRELARWSGWQSDRREAADFFQRVVNRFPIVSLSM